MRGLARLESNSEPIVSIYLSMTRERRLEDVRHSALSSLSRTTLRKLAKDEAKYVRRQLDRVEAALNEELPELGGSAVFFVGEGLGIWRQIALPIPLTDRIHAGPRPYIRPLLRSWGEGDRILVALLSREQSRLFVDHMGQLEEIYRVKGQRIRGMLTDRVQRDRRDVLATQVLRDEARALARMANIITHELETSTLLVAAPPDLRAEFLEHLPKSLRVDQFEADIHAPLHRIASALKPVRERIKAGREAKFVEEIQIAPFEHVAVGVQDTLDCLREGRVSALAVDDRFLEPGSECTQCGALFGQATIGSCPICKSEDIRKTDDLVDITVQKALHQNARVEFIRYPEVQARFGKFAPMSALLRY